MSSLFYWASIFIVYFFTGGTFETVMGGTNKPLPSHLQIFSRFSFAIEVQREEMRKIIMIKVILGIFGVVHLKLDNITQMIPLIAHQTVPVVAH